MVLLDPEELNSEFYLKMRKKFLEQELENSLGLGDTSRVPLKTELKEVEQKLKKIICSRSSVGKAIEEIKNIVKTSSEYEFLRQDKHPLLFLGLGGSYAYGTNIETSDVDIRGCAFCTPDEILGSHKFEELLNEPTDTCVYAFPKLISLLSNCNPNTIEMLGLEPWQYLEMSDFGKEMIEKRHMFLSKKAVNAFGGYAVSQLRRLENISARYVGQEQREKHILESIENARVDFPNMFFPTGDGSIDLYVDNAIDPEMGKEIFMDINLKHYPLRDYTQMHNTLRSIVSSYNNIGKRNKRAIEHGKIAKHSMHLIRLYMMCIDILEKEEIITYRKDEHNLLMSIRNGDFLDENEQPTKEFFDMVDEYSTKLEEAKKNTKLPDKPDYKEIEAFLIKGNKLALEIAK